MVVKALVTQIIKLFSNFDGQIHFVRNNIRFINTKKWVIPEMVNYVSRLHVPIILQADLGDIAGPRPSQ